MKVDLFLLNFSAKSIIRLRVAMLFELKFLNFDGENLIRLKKSVLPHCRIRVLTGVFLFRVFSDPVTGIKSN